MRQRSGDQREIDWYGEREKRKHHQQSRRATWRGFGLGFVLTTVLLAVVVGLFGLNHVIIAPILTATPLNWPLLQSPYLTMTFDPQVQLQNVRSELTATAVFAPTDVPPVVLLAPSLTPFPIATPVPAPDQIEAYRLIGGVLTPVRTLSIRSEVGYQFSAIRSDSSGTLYLSHARTLDPNAACDPNEAIWRIQPDQPNATAIWQSPLIGHPKRIVIDPSGNTDLLAFDCVHRMWAIFRLDQNGRLISAPFAIVGGASLALSADSQLLVGLSDFADMTASQPHLLTLRIDPQTGIISQQVESYQNDIANGHFSTLGFVPADPTHLIAIWDAPGSTDRLLTITSHFATPMPISGTLTVTEVANQSLTPVPTEIPIDTGLSLHNDSPVHLIDLAFYGDQPIGLQSDGRALLTWNATGQIITVPIPDLIARAVTVDPATEAIYLVGSQMQHP